MLVSVFRFFFPELLTQEPKSHKTTQSLKELQSSILILALRSSERLKKKKIGPVNLFLKLENHIKQENSASSDQKDQCLKMYFKRTSLNLGREREI